MIDQHFQAILQKNPNKGGWTYVVWPESQTFFGTKGAVKVAGTIDGQPFQTSFMAMGNGQQMLPVKASIRPTIGKQAGDMVDVHLTQRLG